MVPAPSGGRGALGGAAAARAGGAGPVTLNLTINVHAGGGSGEDIVKKIKASSLLGDLLKTVEDALTGAGIPVQS